jgi:hypothetical protein
LDNILEFGREELAQMQSEERAAARRSSMSITEEPRQAGEKEAPEAPASE